MAITIEKWLVAYLLTAFTLLGCNSHAAKYDPEVMYDLASHLKDVAESVDGIVKFGDGKMMSNDELIKVATESYPERREIFSRYNLLIKIDGANSALLLCKSNVALIEDSGCTAVSDVQHWMSDQEIPCEFTIDVSAICATN